MNWKGCGSDGYGLASWTILVFSWNNSIKLLKSHTWKLVTRLFSRSNQLKFSAYLLNSTKFSVNYHWLKFFHALFTERYDSSLQWTYKFVVGSRILAQGQMDQFVMGSGICLGGGWLSWWVLCILINCLNMTLLGTWRDQDSHVTYMSLEYETYQHDASEEEWLMHSVLQTWKC